MIEVSRNVIRQIFGSLMAKPSLLNDTDKVHLGVVDFSRQIDRYIFTAIYNMFLGEAEVIHAMDIDNYLQDNVGARQLMEKENGLNFLQDCEACCELQNFTYYYNKLKKTNLLRDLQKDGYDIGEFYCEDTLLNENGDEINAKFETLKTSDIIQTLRNRLDNKEKDYCLEHTTEEQKAVDGIRELLQRLNQSPDIGIKLQGDFFNTIVRGGRKGTLYLRSGGSGFGKSRLMVGDACQIAYPIRYDNQLGQWVSTGPCERVLYIMTEQDPEEIQTMVLAWISGVNEECFKYGLFFDPEVQRRVDIAVKIMEDFKNNLLFVRIPDPCESVVKNVFRRYHFQKGIENFFFDYIFSSPAMLNEYRDLNLPEHVCLRLFTTTLKNLALELHSFVMTATQVSEQDNDKKNSWKDYHNIAGARSIVHLVDVGCIISRPTEDELKRLEGTIQICGIRPNFVIDFFKNRGGRWTMIRLWAYHDLGTCRRKDLFATMPDLKPIEQFQLLDFGGEKSQEELELERKYNSETKIDGTISLLTQSNYLMHMDDIPQKEVDITIEEPAHELVLESETEKIQEIFGSQEEKRMRVREKGFDDFL